MPVAVAVVVGFQLRLVALVALVVVERAVEVPETMAPRERMDWVEVVDPDRPRPQQQVEVVRELLWCVMHCQMFRYQIFMQRMTWVVHQQTISHLQQH
jgi:hypothetical protein